MSLLNQINSIRTILAISVLVILVIPTIGAAHAQTTNIVTISSGSGANASVACVSANNCFTPNPITVAPGTTITWTNNDQLGHTITSGKVTDNNYGSLFDSGLISGTTKTASHTFQFTFNNQGTYNYFCSIHPWMTGQVIVGASGTVPTPQPTPPTISITTDRQSYNQGDTIIISGKVIASAPYSAVTLRIFNSHGDLISVAQVLPSSDGSFTKTILITGPLWTDAGTYTITYQYGSLGTPSNQTFYYNGGDGQSTITPSIPTQSSPTSPLITTSVDKSSYTSGDTIVVSGKVLSVVSGTPVVIHIFDPNNSLVQVAQVDVSNDGKYIDAIKAVGSYWKLNGMYTVEVQYGPPNVTAQTSFIFQGSLTPTSSTFQLKDPTSQQIFNVNYAISGGNVKSMMINPQSLAIIVSINSASDGTITLQLPRTLIDAKTTSGQDSTFNILVDGAEVKPQSESADNNFRNITIQFLQGDQQIEIIGTQITNSPTANPTNTSTGITTVTTDKASYNDGDKVTISGTVSNYIANTLVNIRIISPIGNLVKVDQVDLGSDRTFSTSITAIGALWQASGTYQVKAQYGSPDTTITTTFQFSGSNSQSGNIIKVDGTNLSVKYSITNGQIWNMKADTQSKSLTASIQTTGDGVLTVILPRGLIDAILPTGQDDKYYVLVNGQESNFQETSKTTTDRTLSIPFTDGTQELKIIGTSILNDLSLTIPQPLPPTPPANEIDMEKGAGSSATADCVAAKNCFTPNPLNVTPGATVTWTNTDTVSHYISSGNPSDATTGTVFDSGNLIKPGGTYQFAFVNTGTYDYFCTVHPWMIGQVIVGSGVQSSISQSTSTPGFTPTQQDIQNINQAKASQTIAAEVNVGSNQSQTKSIDNNVSVQTTNTAPDSLGVKVSAPDQTGPKVIVFNLNATTINVANLKDLGVMYDGKPISPAPNMDAILHAKSTDNPSFAIVVTQSGVQVLVLVPHFSTHTITLTNMSKVIPAIPEFGPIVGIIVIISIIGSIITSRRFFKA